MSSKKISELPLAQPLTGSETVLGIQNGVSVQVYASALGGGGGGSGGGGGGSGGGNLSNVVVKNSNPIFIFTSNINGEVFSYSHSGTTITVEENDVPLVYDGIGVTAGTYKVDTIPINITVGALSLDGNTLKVANHLGVSATIGNSSIIYNISGTRYVGGAFATNTSQTFTKVQSVITSLPVFDGINTDSSVIVKQSTDVDTNGVFSPLVIQGFQTISSNVSKYGWITVTTNLGVALTGATAIDTSVTPYTCQLAEDSKVSSVTIKMYNQATIAGATLLDTEVRQVVYAKIADPLYVVVTGSQVFKFTTGTSIPTTTNTTLTATLSGALNTYKWQYWNGTTWLDLSGVNNSSTYDLAYNNSAWSTSSLLIRCLSGTHYDETTIIKLYDGSSPYNVEIYSSNGQTFRRGNHTHTVLAAKVFQGANEVTDSFDASQFRWRRVSIIDEDPTTTDAAWNNLYITGYKQVEVSVDDFESNATFFCDIYSLN